MTCTFCWWNHGGFCTKLNKNLGNDYSGCEYFEDDDDDENPYEDPNTGEDAE